MHRGFSCALVAVLALVGLSSTLNAAPKKVGINVLLNAPATEGMLAELEGFGSILDVYDEVNVVTLKAEAVAIDAIAALDFVAAATLDGERKGVPLSTVEVEDFVEGFGTWNLDAVDITEPGYANRVVPETGAGVYVAVLDTGLVKQWPQFFPEERIASEYAISFGGGGGEQGHVSTQPNKWERDVDSHGTHVTSTILGFDFFGNPISGAAPAATIIPVKVLNNNGSGWSSVVAMGILYVAELKAGPLADVPVVINMSLGGPGLDAFEKAAIDYAIAQGVIIVAAAGNEGELGMGYPGAYAPVISVAASGWAGEWYNDCWWYCLDVAEFSWYGQFYITDFSSVALEGQDLDVAAPGSWIVGPYQVSMGQPSYYYLGGTSMASPLVAGIVALMAERYPPLTAADAELILEYTAQPIPGFGPAYAGAGQAKAAWALSVLP